MAKNPCPVSREKFMGNAKPVIVTVNGSPVQADVKDFSTGSFGWYNNGKVNIEVNGQLLSCQCQLQFTVVGSKEAPRTEEQKAELKLAAS